MAQNSEDFFFTFQMKNVSFEYQKAEWKQVSPVCATVSHTFTLQEPVKGHAVHSVQSERGLDQILRR